MVKRIILFLLIAFLFISASDSKRKDVTVKTDIYTIHYSEVYEQPLSVDYVVNCMDSKFSRKGLDFYTCDSIHTSNNADYENNDWDKGHMAPAADFTCDKSKLAATFSYLNCALQHKNLNRGVWKSLEEHERVIAKEAKSVTTVNIKVHFSKTSVKLSTGATIPDGFTKTITSGSLKEVYYFPNTIPTKSSYKDYIKK
jgi:endonuclease G